MTVVERVNSKIRIVKYPPALYQRPFIVQKKTGLLWFNTPSAMNPKTFESHQDAKTFAKKFTKEAL